MLRLSKNIQVTKELTEKANFASLYEEADLQAIADQVFIGYSNDKASRASWERRTEAALNLALQVVASKNFPWANCSNIAFPLVTIAAMQFHAEAYPTIFQGTDLVKYRMTGNDPQGTRKALGDLISDHMSYQLSYEDQSWEEQHDRLLLSVPIVGCAFTKSYHTASERQNRSELIMAHDLVMDYYAKSVESCRRKTHRFPLNRNDIYERCMAGVYVNVLEEPWFNTEAPVQTSQHTAAEDKRTGKNQPQADEETPFWGLEQHRYLDLDGDGYYEPYIVTIEESSKKLLRIVTRYEWKDVEKTSQGKVIRIRATEFFTKYSFIPSPDGSVYDLGFGVLLGPLNEATNSIFNQLVDAGTLANAGGGFLARGAKMRAGQYTMSPLEWKPVETSGDDLRKSIFPLPVREPSQVLFSLLSLLINYAGRVAGTTDTMVGENPGQNTPASNMQTMVQNGMRVYKAIFKRVWRSMKQELEKLYLLNAYYLPDSPIPFGDKGQTIQRKDYLTVLPANIMPATDPNVVSETLRHQIATAVKQSAMGTPGYSIPDVERNWLKTLHVEGSDILYPGPDKVPPLPNPKVQVEQMKMEAKQQELQFQKLSFIADLQEQQRMNQAKIIELHAKAAKELAEAQGVESGHQIAAFEAAIGAMKSHNDHITKQIELMMKGMENESANNQQGAVRGMANPSGESSSPQENSA